jgi:hypothetical protein
MAAEFAEVSTVRVLIYRLNSLCSRSIKCGPRAVFAWLGGRQVKMKMYSPASSRLSATAWCLSRGWRMRVLRGTSIFARSGPHRSCRCNRRYPLVQALRRVDVDRSGALVSAGPRPTRIRFSQRKTNEAHRSQAAPSGREPKPLSQRHRRPRSFRQIRIAAKG